MKSIDKKALGLKFNFLRKLFDYSQDEMAKKIKIPRLAVVQIEKGERNISSQELFIICDIFGIDMRYFMVADIKGLKAQYHDTKVNIDEFKHYSNMD